MEEIRWFEQLSFYFLASELLVEIDTFRVFEGSESIINFLLFLITIKLFLFCHNWKNVI